MRNASGHQWKVKVSGSETKREWETYDISVHKTCNVLRSFWKFHVAVGQNNGKEMYKKASCTCKAPFLLIRPIVVFHHSPALPLPL